MNRRRFFSVLFAAFVATKAVPKARVLRNYSLRQPEARVVGKGWGQDIVDEIRVIEDGLVRGVGLLSGQA